MKTEDLYSAVGNVSDKYVDDVLTYRKRPNFKMISGMAAAFIAVIAITLAFMLRSGGVGIVIGGEVIGDEKYTACEYGRGISPASVVAEEKICFTLKCDGEVSVRVSDGNLSCGDEVSDEIVCSDGDEIIWTVTSDKTQDAEYTLTAGDEAYLLQYDYTTDSFTICKK